MVHGSGCEVGAGIVSAINLSTRVGSRARHLEPGTKNPEPGTKNLPPNPAPCTLDHEPRHGNVLNILNVI